MMIQPKCILLLIAVVILAAALIPDASGQRKDRFTHSSTAHKKLECSSCHKIPTGNWPTARGFPDVADYPGHAACFACHRQDFFAGNRPAICAICHVNPGPRGVARLPFPHRTRSKEFSSIFPHNVHQDIIASNFIRIAAPPSEVRFVRASLTYADDDKPQFNNCAICHTTLTELPKTSPRIPSGIQPLADAAANAFVPTAGFFKSMPSGHTACFTCHYQSVKPTANQCASCHSLTAPYAESRVFPRYSLKFDHQQKEHALRDCMTCHVRISQNADLKAMKDADVPIMTCSTSSCHGGKILEEIGKRESSITEKQAASQCTYCHTPDIGRFPVPPSHLAR